MLIKFVKATILLVLVTLVSCNNNKTTAKPQGIKKINRDSLRMVKQQTDNLWETYKLNYGILSIDTLPIDSTEKYRLVIIRSWPNKFGGNPTSITFYKTPDTCYVVIKDVYKTYTNWSKPFKSLVTKVVKFCTTAIL